MRWCSARRSRRAQRCVVADQHCDHFWAADAVEWCFYDIDGEFALTEEDIRTAMSMRYGL